MTRGRFDVRLEDWRPGGNDREFQDATFQARPSFLAALDMPVKALGAVGSVLLPFFIIESAQHGRLIGLAALLTLGVILQIGPAVVLALAPALHIFFTRYLIDDEGIRVFVQILSRTESRVTWDKVTAVRHRVTVIDRLLGIERIDIIAYGERGTTLHLVGLRNARAVRDLVARKMRQNASLGGLLTND